MTSRIRSIIWRTIMLVVVGDTLLMELTAVLVDVVDSAELMPTLLVCSTLFKFFFN